MSQISPNELEWASHRIDIRLPAANAQGGGDMANATNSPLRLKGSIHAKPAVSDISKVENMVATHSVYIMRDAHNLVRTEDKDLDQWFANAESTLFGEYDTKNRMPPTEPRLFALVALTLYHEYNHRARPLFWNPAVKQETARKIVETLEEAEFSITPRNWTPISKNTRDAYPRPDFQLARAPKAPPIRKSRPSHAPKRPTTTQTGKKRGRPRKDRDDEGNIIKRPRLSYTRTTAISAVPSATMRVINRDQEANATLGSLKPMSEEELHPILRPITSLKRKRVAPDNIDVRAEDEVGMMDRDSSLPPRMRKRGRPTKADFVAMDTTADVVDIAPIGRFTSLDSSGSASTSISNSSRETTTTTATSIAEEAASPLTSPTVVPMLRRSARSVAVKKEECNESLAQKRRVLAPLKPKRTTKKAPAKKSIPIAATVATKSTTTKPKKVKKME